MGKDQLFPRQHIKKKFSKFDELKKHKPTIPSYNEATSDSFPDWEPSEAALKHKAFYEILSKMDKSRKGDRSRNNKFEMLKKHPNTNSIGYNYDNYDSEIQDDLLDDESMEKDNNMDNSLVCGAIDVIASSTSPCNESSAKNTKQVSDSIYETEACNQAVDSVMPDTNGLEENAITTSCLSQSTSEANNTGILENGPGEFAEKNLSTGNGYDNIATVPSLSNGDLHSSQNQITKIVSDVVVENSSTQRNEKYHPNTLILAQRVIIRYRVKNVNHDMLFRDPDNCVYHIVNQDEVQGYILEECYKEAQMYGKPQILKYSSEFMSALTALTPEDIISDNDTIAFLDCFYDYASNRYRPFSEYGDRYVTASIQAYIMADDHDCKHFYSFVQYAFYGNSALYERFMELLGLFLSNDMNAKVMGVFYGPSNTGKSLAIQIFQMFYEPDKTESILAIQKYGDRFALSTIVGKHLMSFGDLPNDVIPDAALSNIKAITGKDKVQVEAKYKALHGYRPECKLLFGTNHKLLSSTRDDAFEQRVIVVPFLRQVPRDKMDGDLVEKIRAEKGAIAREAIKAYRKLRKNRYQFTPLPPEYNIDIFEHYDYTTTNSNKANQAFSEVRDFIETCCEFDINSFICTEELYRVYCSFCESNVLVRRDKKYFSTLLNQICGDKVEKHKRGNNNGFQGIALKED